MHRQGSQNQLYETSTEKDVFKEKLKGEAEGKIPPQIFGKRRAKGYIISEAPSEPTKGYIAKKALFWAFLNRERVERQGGQNQLHEGSTEKDISQKKPE